MTKSARIPVAGACLLFLACCSLPWVGLWNPNGVADTGLYSLYGGRMAHGLVPYRDFFIEFPPGALPALVIPALPRSNYVVWFKIFEFLCGAGTLVCLGIILTALRVSRRNMWIALGLAAIAPAALGAITLNSFDYWPALLTTAAVAALVSRRVTVAFALLGAATTAKLFPAGLLPLALLFAVPQLGRWRRPLIAYAGTLFLIVAPFAILGPGGLRFSLHVQLRRGLQLESLGASVLATAHHFGLYDAHYTPNLAYAQLSGTTASTLATVSTVVMVAAIALVAWLYHRTRGEASDLVRRRVLVRPAAQPVTDVVQTVHAALRGGGPGVRAIRELGSARVARDQKRAQPFRPAAVAALHHPPSRRRPVAVVERGHQHTARLDQRRRSLEGTPHRARMVERAPRVADRGALETGAERRVQNRRMQHLKARPRLARAAPLGELDAQRIGVERGDARRAEPQKRLAEKPRAAADVDDRFAVEAITSQQLPDRVHRPGQRVVGDEPREGRPVAAEREARHRLDEPGRLAAPRRGGHERKSRGLGLPVDPGRVPHRRDLAMNRVGCGHVGVLVARLHIRRQPSPLLGDGPDRARNLPFAKTPESARNAWCFY